MSNSSKDPKPFVQAGEPLHEFLPAFWRRQIDAAEQETPDYRHPPLPLARIKKVMKSDPDVKVRISHLLAALCSPSIQMIAADGVWQRSGIHNDISDPSQHPSSSARPARVRDMSVLVRFLC